MTNHHDPQLTAFEVQVYNWMAKSIREDGAPMKQAMIANKLKCGTSTVRVALIELDKRGHLKFKRYASQGTTLPFPDRVLVAQPIAAMPWDV